MMLAIDAGNTRIKWGLFDTAGEMQTADSCFHDALTRIKLPTADRAIISNVAGDTIAQQLTQTILNTSSDRQTSIQWVNSEAEACGVKNTYQIPDTLGTDRWAAMIGAWHMHHQACVIVNVGTTVTIDAVIPNANSGVFIGGLILPGLYLMQSSLHTNTAQLPNVNQLKNNTSVLHQNITLGLNTHDAIQYGALSAVAGAIEQVAATLTTKTNASPLIIMTGGDASVIEAYLSNKKGKNSVIKSMQMVDNLVLLGLYQLSIRP